MLWLGAEIDAGRRRPCLGSGSPEKDLPPHRWASPACHEGTGVRHRCLGQSHAFDRVGNLVIDTPPLSHSTSRQGKVLWGAPYGSVRQWRNIKIIRGFEMIPSLDPDSLSLGVESIYNGIPGALVPLTRPSLGGMS